MKPVLAAATLTLLTLTGKGMAHEFWIDPVDFMIDAGDALVADIRVGEDFVGAPSSFLPQSFEAFAVIAGTGGSNVNGRLGDIPALNMEGVPEGLSIIIYQSNTLNIVWSEWERFLGFAEHKDLGDVTAMHEDRGLSLEDVSENYIRYAKSMVSIGEGAGTDRQFGLRAELVSLTNPYTDDTTGGIEMQLYYDGALQPDYQVELFAENADGEVEITLHRTNAEGVVTLPVEPGMNYMADAVFLEELDPETSDNGAIWATHWANMTFATPE